MTIIVAILLFGAIVFIHELGHFLLAKKNGVKIHEFAIGMGPKIFTIHKDVEYTIRLLPLGGFVSMEGEDGDSNDARSFGNKSILQRASILFSGPFFNMIFTVILFIPVFMYIGSPTTTLNQVVDNSPAQIVGLKVGDTIKSVDGENVKTWDELVNTLTSSDGKEVNLKIDRNGDSKDISITPEKNEEGRYVIGIGPKYEKSIFKAISTAFETTVSMTIQMIQFVGQLITGTLPGGIENSVTGPIGVITMVSSAAKTGIINLLYLGAVISLNLGILNLLPIPGLDGGRLLMLFIEAVRGGKKLDPNKEATINLIGLGALMLFMVFITYKDILKLF